MKFKRHITYFIVLFLLLITKFTLAKDPPIKLPAKVEKKAVKDSSALAEEKPVLILNYQDGQLNVEIKGKTIKEIFEELKKKVGIDYQIEEEIQKKKVTIKIEKKELVQGIKDILNTIGNPSPKTSEFLLRFI